MKRQKRQKQGDKLWVMIWACHVEILYTWTTELSMASYSHLHYKIYNFSERVRQTLRSNENESAIVNENTTKEMIQHNCI